MEKKKDKEKVGAVTNFFYKTAELLFKEKQKNEEKEAEPNFG